MPLRPELVRTFHRCLFSGWNQTVQLLKRKDDQQAGTVTRYELYDCYWGLVTKSGQPIKGEMQTSHRRTLHIPRIELERVGVHYIMPLDRFIDAEGRTWQPESTTQIAEKLQFQHVDVDCLLIAGEMAHS